MQLGGAVSSGSARRAPRQSAAAADPGLAVGARKVHCRLLKSNATERSTRMVNVSVLEVGVPVGTFPKCRVFCPATTDTVAGARDVTVAVNPVLAKPVLTTSARYVTNHCVLLERCSLTSW